MKTDNVLFYLMMAALTLIMGEALYIICFFIERIMS